MSVTPEMIDAMIAAGLTREQMATLMKASLAQAEAEKADKRAKAAAKKRRQRAGVTPVTSSAGNAECPPMSPGHMGTNGDIGGQTGTEGDNPAAPLDGPPLPPAPPSPPLNPPTTPGSDADASGSSAEPNVPLSPKDLLWRDGVLTLRGLGLTDPAARRFVGKLLRDTAGDAGRVHWAIDEARHAETGDPIPFVTRILNDTPTNTRTGVSRFEGRDSAATILLKRDAEARRHEQSSDQSVFLDDGASTGGSEPRGRSPRDASSQRDRMGGTGQILDLVAVSSNRR